MVVLGHVRLARKIWALFCLPFLKCKEKSFGRSVQLAVSSRLRAGKSAIVRIGDFANIAGDITVLGNLSIGKNVFIAPGTRIWVCEGATLSIGDFSKLMGADLFVRENVALGRASLLAPETMIHDNNGHSTDAKKRLLWMLDNGYPHSWCIDDNLVESPISSAPVVLGENVWLGRRCIVLKGVSIGSNSVVGAGSVVTKSIPQNCLAAGNPAKVIKKLE